MIALEIRNDEIRGLVSNGRFKLEIQAAHSQKIDKSIIEELFDGEVEKFNSFIIPFLQELDFEYEYRNYSISVNLAGTMTQKNSIPKVKKKDIPAVLRSVLVSEGALITEDTEFSYSIIKNKEKGKIGMYSHILSQNVSDGITKAFNQLNLKVKYIDVSPNTLIKAFDKSDFSKKELPLQLVVDLSPNEVKYYQFEDKILKLNYLENADFLNSENCLDYVIDNIQLFNDEYEEYTLEDMEVILMGDEDVVEFVKLGIEDKVSVSKFSEGISSIDNFSFERFDLYINTLGSLLRNDKVLTTDSKYDVNLLDKSKVSLEGDYGFLIKGLGISVLLFALVSSIYLVTIHMDSKQLKEDNTVLEKYISEPDIKAQYEEAMEIDSKKRVYRDSLDTMIAAEKHLTEATKSYTAKAVDAVYFSLPAGTKVDGELELSGGEINFTIHANEESSFLNYTSMLELQGDLFSEIKYSSYSGSKEDGYTGSITLVLGGANNE